MLELSDKLQHFTGQMALTALFLLASGVLIARSEMVGRQAKVGFLQCIVVALVIVVTDWFTVCLDGQVPALHNLHTFATALEFALAPVIPVIIARAIIPNDHFKLFAIVLVVHAVFEFGSCIGGYVFWVDDANLYHRGPLYLVYIAVYLVCSVFLVVESVRASRVYQTRNRITMAAIVICLASGVLIQTLVSSVHISWTAVAMALLLYFAYYCDTVQQTDALTSLLNRRSYEHFLEHPHAPCVIISLDVDDFKKTNDGHGHSFGDAALTTVARQVRRSFGGSGKCYRIGGDEFCVVLMRRLDDVERLVGEFERAMRAEHTKDSRIPLVSAGWARLDDAQQVAAAVDAADHMMYARKHDRKATRGEAGPEQTAL